ncbi:unnamed protein product [Orchesella dallaii]|uniref:Uncharacterized protein n=1 Tax=Orchesella dallaii TaxID=48710 RepID=A0ABP1QVR8_9HEXA
MLFSWPLLVAFTTLLVLYCISHSTHALPFDGNLISENSNSLSNSLKSHNMDLLIDPIHQAEYEDEELESKIVARSIFDMVLRTPPPPTSSYTRSTDPVAVVDQEFLLDTLRELTKEGVLLGPGANRPRRAGGNNNRRKPKTPTSVTTAQNTQEPITTITTELPLETTSNPESKKRHNLEDLLPSRNGHVEDFGILQYVQQVVLFKSKLVEVKLLAAMESPKVTVFP